MLVDKFKENLKNEGLQILNNNYDEIFELYNNDSEFAKLSNAYPTKMENVIEDVEEVPPFTDAEHKYFFSIYNSKNELIAVLDIIEEYNFKDISDKECIWIGLLDVDVNKHRKGIGSLIIRTLMNACKENNIRLAQLGVIKNNKKGFKFWSNMGFTKFEERSNDKYDLILMEKTI